MLYLHNSDIVFDIVCSSEQTEKEVTFSYLVSGFYRKLLRQIPHDIIFFFDNIMHIDKRMKRAHL